MKTIKLSIAGVAILSLIFSCSGNKEAELAKLKEQHAAITEKITALETVINAGKKDTLQPEKFKFVGLKDVSSNKFDHFIRIQGKLDGDQNAAVFAEAPGTVSSKFADVGQKVVRGQVLAQIDDQQYRSQLDGLETQYKFASEMFEKQQRLWEQKIGSEVQYLQ